MADQEKMKELYRCNDDFKSYVDKDCMSYGYTVSEALELALVKEAALYYMEKRSGGEAGKGGIRTDAGNNYAGDLGNGIPV